MRWSCRRIVAAAAALVAMAAPAAAGAAAGPPPTLGGGNAESCSGPRPLGPDGVRYMAVEGELTPSRLGENCLPAGDTLSSATLDWGDGTSGPATVTYHPLPADAGYRQAWIEAPHRYARATCVDPRSCTAAYRVTATAIEERSGAPITLRALVTVTPGSSYASPVRVRALRGRTARGPVATIRTAGVRSTRELSARIRWGDGSRGSGRVAGHGHTFRVLGAHRWRHWGRYPITVVITDSFARVHFSARSSAHVVRRPPAR